MGAEPDLETAKLSQQVHDVWRLRLTGKSSMRIAEELKISPQDVNQMIVAAHEAIKADISQMAEIEMHLDKDRQDRLLEAWFPLAINTEMIVTKVIRDEAIETVDFDKPYRAMLACLAIMQMRAKKFGYDEVREGSADQAKVAIMVRYLEDSKEMIRQLTQR